MISLLDRVSKLTGLAARLATGSSGLDGKTFTAGLEFLHALLGPSGQVHMDGGAHAGAEVGGAGVDVTVLVRVSIFFARLSLDRLLHSLDATGKTGEDALDIAALLHGDDAGLVLLVHPQQEGLGVIVEDSTALRPVALHTSNLKLDRNQ